MSMTAKVVYLKLWKKKKKKRKMTITIFIQNKLLKMCQSLFTSYVVPK